jgi:C-terminal processing protease CtpA/Prc
MTIEVLDFNPVGTRNVTLTRANHYEYPILAEEVYEEYNTAYLAYTHFVTGDTSGPHAYASQMRAAFGRFRDAGVRNLILDLRYNGGGEVSMAQLLASLIAPASALGNVFMYTENNTGTFQPMNLLTSQLVPENAGIEKLYVITSQNTASASELIIHSLKPFYGGDLCVIGETTMGKNVGSVTFTNEELGWELTPMMFRIYDKNKVSGYEAGIDPDEQVSEFGFLPGENQAVFTLGTLGDYEHERLLNIAMHELNPEIPLAPFSDNPATRSTARLSTTARIPERGLSFGMVGNN